MNKKLTYKIEDLEFSVRVISTLMKNNIKTVGDLVQKTRDELIRIPNFGIKSFNEIKEVLGSMSLELGMNIDAQPKEEQPTVFDLSLIHI